VTVVYSHKGGEDPFISSICRITNWKTSEENCLSNGKMKRIYAYIVNKRGVMCLAKPSKTCPNRFERKDSWKLVE
jgi:hypothetical protein